MTTDLSNRNLIPRDNLMADHYPSGFEMKPRTLEDAMKFCDMMCKSDLVPKCYQDKPGNIMVAIQMGSELGLTPMRALRSIAVINGRATMWGDDVLAMVLASSVCEYVDENDSTDKQGVCKTKRTGCAEQVSIFTLDDAKRAGLSGKQGPWQTHTSRMLKLRARGFGLRDTFADVLAGLISAEEALDFPRIAAEDMATAIPEANGPSTLEAEASRMADMDDAELAEVQEALRHKQQQAKPAPYTGPKPPTPASQPTTPAMATATGGHAVTGGTAATQDSLELPTPVRLPAGAISATQWAEVIAFIDSNLDLGTLKHDWKIDHKVDNVIRLTEGGKQKFLEFMRDRAGAAFPF